MIAGDSSEDEDGWRVHEKYCIDHRSEFDMHEIIDNIFTRAAEFIYPYPFFLRETSDFSPRFNLHRLVSPFRLLILGQTYGTYLHYERTYTTNVPTL
jgi:hypothetical protein